VTPTDNRPGCSKTEGLLVLRENEVAFAPDQGAWVLNGTAAPDGSILAEHGHQTSSSTSYITTFQGHWTEDAVTGTYTTPRCTYAVDLRRR